MEAAGHNESDRIEGASEEQVAELLSLGSELALSGDADPTDEQLATVLDEELEQALESPGDSGSGMSYLARLASGENLAAERVIAALTGAPGSPERLNAVKSQTKRAARMAGEETRKTVATAIYYAAIASAMVHHGQRISSHDDATLDRAFRRLSGKKWMRSELVELYEAARDWLSDESNAVTGDGAA